MDELKPCPFCGGDNIGYSVKGAKDYPFWYVAMYCKTCHCYGARTRATVQIDGWIGRRAIEASADAKAQAIELWNRRAGEQDD